MDTITPSLEIKKKKNKKPQMLKKKVESVEQGPLGSKHGRTNSNSGLLDFTTIPHGIVLAERRMQTF